MKTRFYELIVLVSSKTARKVTDEIFSSRKSDNIGEYQDTAIEN